MKSQALWCSNIPKPQDANTTLTNQVWGLTLNNDGTYLVAAVGDSILLYETLSGRLEGGKPLRNNHKDQIMCLNFSKDNKYLATGGLDRQVIVWKFNAAAPQSKLVAELKYSQNDAVLCLAFNPITQQIFSAGSSDYCLWTPEVSQTDKSKYKEKIISCAWSSDGQIIAFGTISGTISLRTRNMEEKMEIRRSQAIWCMQWSPITMDQQETNLLVGTWDQTLTYYNSEGKQIGTEKKVDFDPISIDFQANGELYAVSGSNKKVMLMTKDGGFLTEICQKNDWIWNVKIRSKDMIIGIGTNDGDIQALKVSQLMVKAIYQDKYAYRENLTDIIVQNMMMNQKIRIKCKELVKGISIYREKLAALLNDRVLIYASLVQDVNLKYKLFKRVNKKIECQGLEIVSNHLVIFQKKKIQIMQFNGEIEREWIFDSKIRSFHIIGGPPRKEGVLVALHSGAILKIFLDNSFPLNLYQHSVPISIANLSLNKRNLAFVDDNKNLTVLDTQTKEIYFTEMNVSSCAFNSDFNDMLAYSGNDMIFIKCSNHQALMQKMKGAVIGLQGSKMFVFENNQMHTKDISQTTTMMKYIEKKDFVKAYEIANLGITENDFKTLGIEALNNGNFEIAKRCFVRIMDYQFVELIEKYEREKTNQRLNEVKLQGEVQAYQGKFTEAETIFVKSSQPELAMQLYSELKRFNDVKRIAQQTRKPGQQDEAGALSEQMKKVLKEEAEWKMNVGEWKEGAKLLVQCQEYKKAIDLFGKYQYMEGILEVCRQIDKKDEAQNLQLCAYYFRRYKHHDGAKEAYLKLGDQKSLMALHIELERWDDALLLGKQKAELMEIVKLPYASWLCSQDRYIEALRAFKQIGRFDLTSRMLIQLQKNSIIEQRFSDASYFAYLLAMEAISQVQNAKNPSPKDKEFLAQYNEQFAVSEIFQGYGKIVNYLEEPELPNLTEQELIYIFNAAKFTISRLGNRSIYGVKADYLYFALGRVSKMLECYKTARICYDKILQYKISREWEEEMELCSLLVKSKPIEDKQDLLSICNRCMTPASAINNGHICISCKQPLVHSAISFENLPLIEFKVSEKLNHRTVLELLNSPKTKDKQAKPKKKIQDDDGWTESMQGNEQVLTFHNSPGKQDDYSPFLQRVQEFVEVQQTCQEYTPVVLEEHIIKSLDIDEIYWVDLSKHCPTTEIKYYKNMIPDIPLRVCQDCGKFSLLDEYEFEYQRSKQCPFCRTLDKREGPAKDVFDV